MDKKQFEAALRKLKGLFEQTHKMYSVGTEKTQLELGEDGDAYTNKTLVHIGLSLNGVLGQLLQKTEGEFSDDDLNEAIDIINYLIGHECGHVRYTDDDQYAWGINYAVVAIVAYAYEKYEGRPAPFTDITGAANYMETLNETAEYVLSHQAELEGFQDMIKAGDFTKIISKIDDLCNGKNLPVGIRSKLVDMKMAANRGAKKDVKANLNMLLKKDSFHSVKALQNLTAWLENSLEDGRMEGCMASRYEIFKNQRRKYRIIFRDHDGAYPSVKELEDPKVLIDNIMSAILSLATTQMYKKGFSMFYHQVPETDKPAAEKYIQRIEMLHKDIYDAYTGEETMACSKANVSICKKLAPVIWEAFGTKQKNTLPEDIKKMLEKLLKAVIEANIDNLNAGTKKAPATEQRDSSFPFSDLTVTLDDDTYDKLMEKMKNQGKSEGDGINIKREHPLPPKEQDTKSPEQDGEAQEQQSGQNSNMSENQAQNGSGQSGHSGESGQSGENSNAGSEQTGQNGNTQGQENQGQNSPGSGSDTGADDQNAAGSGSGQGQNEKDSFEDFGENAEQSPAYEASSDGDKSSSGKDSNASGDSGKSGTESQSSDSTGSSNKEIGKMAKDEKAEAAERLEKELEQQIAEAKKSIGENLKDQIDLAKAAAEAEVNRRNRIKEVPASSETITKEEVKKICDVDFIEIPRKFPVDQKLRSDLQSRGNVARRNMEKILIPKKDRDITHMTSGGIDVKRLGSLGMGKTDVFKRLQKGKKFSGCVYILKDNSGSMSGNKNRYACESMAVLEETYKGLLPLKISAFSAMSGVEHQVIKDWDEIRKDNLSWNFLNYTRPRGGNSDGYDIQIASYELQKRPERKKLLIVLSDGMPSESTPGYTKGAIEKARQQGVEVCGIYFEDGNIEKSATAEQFKDMYEKDYICCNAKDIDKHLLKLMRKFCR